MRTWPVAVCLIAWSTAARAEIVACTEDACACAIGPRVVLVSNPAEEFACTGVVSAKPGDHARWEGAVAGEAGWLGRALPLALGFDLDAGVRFRRLAVLGEYRLLALQASAGIAALASEPIAAPAMATALQQVGIVARYSVLATPRSELWFEGGAGEQLVGSRSRPVLDLGIGASIGERAATHHGAAFVAVRAMMARTAAASFAADPVVLLLAAGFAFGS